MWMYVHSNVQHLATTHSDKTPFATSYSYIKPFLALPSLLYSILPTVSNSDLLSGYTKWLIDLLQYAYSLILLDTAIPWLSLSLHLYFISPNPVSLLWNSDVFSICAWLTYGYNWMIRSFTSTNSAFIHQDYFCLHRKMWQLVSQITSPHN